MKILMTGGTGFVGQALARRLAGEGHLITILTRSATTPGEPVAGITFLQADPTRPGPWQERIGEHEAIVNLAGASIFDRRWTEAYKQELRESRLATTRNLVEGLPADAARTVFLSASAVGYYGFHGDEELAEDAPPGQDFLAQLCRDWEAEALAAAGKGARVVLARLGIVLGEQGGALGQMLPLFRFCLGGPIGGGQQWFSWIHLRDLTEALVFLLQHPEVSGPVNLCGPQPVRNADLTKALGSALHRPAFLPAPGFMIRLVLGEFGSVILEGQRVVPRKLLEAGFPFSLPRIEDALRDLVDQ